MAVSHQLKQENDLNNGLYYNEHDEYSSKCRAVWQHGQLSYIGHECYRVPDILGKVYGYNTRRLDLSFNSIRSLEGLEMFPALEELILDNNDLEDTISFKCNPHLHTLSLNKNKIQDLYGLLDQIAKCCPNLSYLSLLGNPACPDQLSSTEKDEEDYQRYRYYVLYRLRNLKFLDSTPVNKTEKQEAVRVGAFMKVVRPKLEDLVIEDMSEEAEDALNTAALYNPLPPSPESGHKGAFGVLRYRYSGKHSEGNRFIRDQEL